MQDARMSMNSVSVYEQGRVLMQAKAKRRDGRVHVVIVTEFSDHQRFFLCYTTKTMRTPRKYWKYAGYGVIDNARPFGKDEYTLDVYLSPINIHIMQPPEWKIRYPHTKTQFMVWMMRIAHPVRQDAPEGATFEYVRTRTQIAGVHNDWEKRQGREAFKRIWRKS